jgi:epoxyqueuosine reductase
LSDDTPPDAHVDPVALLEMTDAQILDRWRRWYIHDREPRWVRRNALIVLGNTGDRASQRVRRVIEAALVSDDAMIRAHAVWAAARLGFVELLPNDDPDSDVRHELHSLPSPRA